MTRTIQSALWVIGSVFLAYLPTQLSAAGFDPTQAGGAQTCRSTAPDGATEVAMRARPFPAPGVVYTDQDDEKESILCGFDFYKGTGKNKQGEDIKIVICPKDYSTNPGVDVHVLPDGMTTEDFQAHNCTKKTAEEAGSKKLAKFKQSITCSYTPSILAYYHFGRFLGIGNVEPAVVRTMDLDQHRKMTALALKNVHDGLIATDWKEYQGVEGVGPGASPNADSPKGSRIFTAGGKQIYGALQTNPEEEIDYPNENMNGKTPDETLKKFQASAAYHLVATPDSLPTGKTGQAPTFNQENVQKFTETKDFSDMLVIDYVLNQQDRFGNIHDERYWYSQDGSGRVQVKVDKDKDKKGQASDKTEEAPPRSFLINRLKLKDNDCGVAKTNIVKRDKLLESLAHMSRTTYQKLFALNNVLQTPAVQSWLKSDLLFTDADVASIRSNTANAVQILQGRCQTGALRLDADLDSYLARADLSDTRNLCAVSPSGTAPPLPVSQAPVD